MGKVLSPNDESRLLFWPVFLRLRVPAQPPQPSDEKHCLDLLYCRSKKTCGLLLRLNPLLRVNLQRLRVLVRLCSAWNECLLMLCDIQRADSSPLQRYHVVGMKHDHLAHFIWHKRRSTAPRVRCSFLGHYWRYELAVMHREEAVSHLSSVVWKRPVVEVLHMAAGIQRLLQSGKT